MGKYHGLDITIQEIQRYLSVEQIDDIGKRTGFIQRRRNITASDFLYLCLSESKPFLQHSLARLCGHLFTTRKVEISTEGLNQRFSSKAVEFLKEVLTRLLSLKYPQIFKHRKIFARIRIVDSTGFSLPVTYENGYAGSTTSGVKIQLEYDLVTGEFLHLAVRDGKESDIKFAREINQTLLKGDLCIRDLGYFSVGFIKEIDEKEAFYISRLRTQIKMYKKENQAWEEIELIQLGSSLQEGETLEISDVYMGQEKHYVPRLIIHHLTEEQLQRRKEKEEKRKKKKGTALASATLQKNPYNYIITNIPYYELSTNEVYTMYSLRWQIEILFKTWKSIYGLNEVKKTKKERFECHLYSTLIAIVISITLAFQARAYLHYKKNIEVSEYKAIGLLHDYLPQFLNVFKMAQEHNRAILHILEKHGIKAQKGRKLTSGRILKEVGVV
jgi:hypothetical protein